jgi:hypothetical protein
MPATSAFRLSIFEMLSLILVPGLGIAAMRAGGVGVIPALLAGMLWFMAMTVAALFGKGDLRTFAGGFVVVGAIYGGLILYSGPTEFSSHGRLPTTQALTPLYGSISTTRYINLDTNEALTKAEVHALRVAPKAGLANRRWPDEADFMAVSHLLIGLLLGYLGGKLGVALGHPQGQT